MAYNLNWTVQISELIDAQTYGVSKSTVIQTTSSNAIQQTATLTGSVPLALSVGQLTNVVGIGVYNDNTIFSSSVVIVGQNGTPLAYIYPGQCAAIPWSASLTNFSASATTGQTASIQYSLMQA